MTTDTIEGPPRGSAVASVIAVWLFVVVSSGVTAALAAPGERLQWFPMILGAATILAFCLQLSLRSKVGFVTRISITVSGAVVLLAAATGLDALASVWGG